MPRVRFIEQFDGYSCGAVAAMNALKWLGRRVNYRKHFNKIKSLCKTDKDKGTFIVDIYRGLRHMGVKAKYEADGFTSRDLLMHLWNGGAIILGFDWKEATDKQYSLHVVFVFFDGKNLIGVNIPLEDNVCVVPQKILNRRSHWHGLRIHTDEVIYLSKQALRP